MDRCELFFKEIINKFNLLDKKVLDIGCGEGRLKLFLEENNLPLIVGLDNSLEKIREAKRYKYVAVGDGCGLSFKRDSFDFATEIQTLHHMKNYKKAIKEVYICLKKGGYFVLMDAVDDNPLFRAGRNIHPTIDGMPITSRYMYKELKNSLKEAGFVVTKERRFGIFLEFFPYLPEVVKRLFSKIDSILEIVIPERYYATCIIVAKKK